MTVQENHISKILSAKCKVVCEADKLLSKLNYGDDIDCCSNKLISAVQLINRLECYCFEISDENTCYNCIEESDLPKMYAVLNTLLS